MNPVARAVQVTVAARILAGLLTPAVAVLLKVLLETLVPMVWRGMCRAGSWLWCGMCATGAWLWQGACAACKLLWRIMCVASNFVYIALLMALSGMIVYEAACNAFGKYPEALDWVNDWLARLAVNMVYGFFDSAAHGLRKHALALLGANSTVVTTLQHYGLL